MPIRQITIIGTGLIGGSLGLALRKKKFAEVWNDSVVFEQLRDTGNLKGKCGCCEFRNVCMGCRARAFAATGDMLDPEPFCLYEPKMVTVPRKA